MTQMWSRRWPPWIVGSLGDRCGSHYICDVMCPRSTYIPVLVCDMLDHPLYPIAGLSSYCLNFVCALHAF